MPADETNGPFTPAEGDLGPDEFEGELEIGVWDEADAHEERSSRTLRTIVAIVALVVIVILVLLLLRACDSTSVSGTQGSKTIAPVPPKVRRENVVSVWIKPNAKLGDVILSAGIRSTSTRSMGNGMYFVFLADGVDAAVVVEKLDRDTRVYDAGFAYDDLKTGASASAPATP
jgi:hypothetical protein